MVIRLEHRMLLSWLAPHQLPTYKRDTGRATENECVGRLHVHHTAQAAAMFQLLGVPRMMVTNGRRVSRVWAGGLGTVCKVLRSVKFTGNGSTS